MRDYKSLPSRKVLHVRLVASCVKAESTAAGYLLCIAVFLVMGLTGS